MMYSFLLIKNDSPGAISVFCDEELFIPELLPKENSKPKRTLYGTKNIVIKNSREKVIFDLWLSIKKETSHTLIIGDTSFDFT